MLIVPNTRRLALHQPLDLRHTLGPIRNGKGDPTCLLRHDACLVAFRAPSGPVTLHLEAAGRDLEVEAWGPGSEWALDHVPVLVGAHDDVSAFDPADAFVADLARRTPGLRIGATHRVFDALFTAVCGLGVSRFEARRTHRLVVEAHGEPAPGPVPLTLVPAPEVLAGIDHRSLHPLGLEQARADMVRRAAARASSLEQLVDLVPEEAERRLRALTGVNLWAAAVVRHVALGDPDAVPVGDLHLKHLVSWAFHNERRGTDAGMVSTLEPFRPHRARVLRLLSVSGMVPPSH